MDTPTHPRVIVAITGASGALYAQRLLQALVAVDAEIFLIVSQLGRRLLADELGLSDPNPDVLVGTSTHRITMLPYRDVGACVASGSFKVDAMVVVPCSNNKLAEMAHGLGDNLITRAAQVTLKEHRRLIVVHREMPLGLIELRNMVALAEAGAIICPANPGFYNIPQTVDDLVNMVVSRILDLLGIEQQLTARWSGVSPLRQAPTPSEPH
jgi:4-hydroxy-3-polyprenylbenzoate decarboxylase